MSNPENFIDEVTEEVRRDRFFGFLRRYGWLVGLVILVGLGGAAWLEWRKSTHRETAEQYGDALTLAMELPDDAARAGSLEDIAAREAGRRAAVAANLAAGEAPEAERAAVAERLAAVAGDAGLPDLWRDLARLKQVMLAGDAMPEAERQAALDALAKPGAPFRPLALEQLALLSLGKGEQEAAVSALQALLQEPSLTPGLQRRATQLLVALGAAPAAG